MSDWAIVLVWLGIYAAGIIIVPPRKLGKGLFTRHVLTRIPPRFLWRDGRQSANSRYMLWVFVSLALREVGVLPRGGGKSFPTWEFAFWTPVIGLLLDDYFFGDDDQTKRWWESAKNKVRWLMALPPSPEPGQVRS